MERLAAAVAEAVADARKELDIELQKNLKACNARLHDAYDRGRNDGQVRLNAAVAQTEAETIKKLGDSELQKRLNNSIANIKAAREEGEIVGFNKYLQNKDEKLLQDRANFQRIVIGKDQEIVAKQLDIQRYHAEAMAYKGENESKLRSKDAEIVALRSQLTAIETPDEMDSEPTRHTHHLAEDVEIADASSSEPGNLNPQHGILVSETRQKTQELENLQHQYSRQSQKLLEVQGDLNQRTQEVNHLRRQCNASSEELNKRQHKLEQQSQELGNLRRQYNENSVELDKRQHKLEQQSQELGNLRAHQDDNPAPSEKEEAPRVLDDKLSEQEAAGDERQENEGLGKLNILETKLAETNSRLATAQYDAKKFKLTSSELRQVKKATETKLQEVTQKLQQTEATLANHKSQAANVSLLVTQLQRKDAAIKKVSEDKSQLEAKVSLLVTQLQRKDAGLIPASRYKSELVANASVLPNQLQRNDTAPATASGDTEELAKEKSQLESKVCSLLTQVQRKDAALEMAARDKSQLEAKASVLRTQLKQKDAAIATANGENVGRDAQIRDLKSQLQQKDAALAKASEEKLALQNAAEVRSSTSKRDDLALQKKQSALEATVTKLEEENRALKNRFKSHKPWYGIGLTSFDLLTSRADEPFDAESASSITQADNSHSADLMAKYNDLLNGKIRNRRLAQQNKRSSPLNPSRHGSEYEGVHDELISAFSIDTQVFKTVMRSMTGHSDNAKRMIATEFLRLPRTVIDKISADPAAAVNALTMEPIQGPSAQGSPELKIQEEASASSSSSQEEQSQPVRTVAEVSGPISYHGARSANQNWSLDEKLLFAGLSLILFCICQIFVWGFKRKFNPIEVYAAEDEPAKSNFIY